MQTDLDYLKGMLGVFIKADDPLIAATDLKEAGYEISSPKGVFHYYQLIERGYISNHFLEIGDPKKLGLVIGINGIKDWPANIRLTSSGQEFAETLQQKDVFEKLKTISDQPLSVLKDVGVELLKSYTKKKFGLSD
ncbi:hypothetical protein [Citrobacter portucalensis]|uniref:hypothetical protein n=1 Tax=Citrobacter portucalensis TaxID=1639133 RepID=UPI0024DEE361|nr:hypothetical protein [Citrobacter portucalensis]MDK2579437.1 hypothetical protein [Citrobacter portucalensis]